MTSVGLRPAIMQRSADPVDFGVLDPLEDNPPPNSEREIDWRSWLQGLGEGEVELEEGMIKS